MTLTALNSENYHSMQSNRDYMSRHQFTDWLTCAKKTAAVLAGDFHQKEQEANKSALFIGTYTHKKFLEPDKFPAWAAEHAGDIYQKNGTKYAAFATADAMVDRLESIQECVDMREAGRTEQIIIGELFGVTWKAQMDLIVETPELDGDMIFDVKSAGDFSWSWSDAANCRVPWYDVHNYWGQAAVYIALWLIARGRPASFVLLGVTKQDPADFMAVHLSNRQRLEREMQIIEKQLPQVMRWKSGADPAKACGRNTCDYCRAHRGWQIETGENVNPKPKYERV
jgi:hypothetical protein